MSIVFNKVWPVYLEKDKIERSELWGREVHFDKGVHVQVTAPSGSGKTSFAHFLYGLRKDYSGTITFNGKDLTRADAEEISSIRQRKMSVVFQDMRLSPDHTLFENIRVKHALEPFHPESQIKEMCARLGIDTKLHQLASKCSYGEQQRAAIVRCLQQPFEFLLLDEPFSHLDNNNSRLALQLILEEVEKRNAAMIMADLELNEDFPATKTLRL